MKFSVKLDSVPVILTSEDNVERDYILSELTGAQREVYNDQFKFDLEMVDGKTKASAGKGFKLMTATEFLLMCLTTDEGKKVERAFLAGLPAKVSSALHNRGLELSGLDPKALEAAKNALEAKDSSGTE